MKVLIICFNIFYQQTCIIHNIEEKEEIKDEEVKNSSPEIQLGISQKPHNISIKKKEKGMWK